MNKDFSSEDRCHEIQTLLLEYADQKLSGGKGREIKEHLGHCPDCTRFASRLEALKAAMASEPTIEPEPEIYARLSQKMNVQGVNVKRRLPDLWTWVYDLLHYRIPVYQFALGLGILLFALLIGHNPSSRTVPLSFEESLADTTEIARNWDFMERQALEKGIQADTVLTTFIVSTM